MISSSANISNKKDGYIYIYTYRLLYDSLVNHNQKTKLNWLKVDNSIVSNGNVSKLTQYDHSKGYILCKIGMTTKNDVQIRLKEWESHCHHPVTNLTPDRVSFLIQRYTSNYANFNSNNSSSNSNSNNNKSFKFISLSKLFQQLSIKENYHHNHLHEIPQLTTNHFSTYKNGGFYVCKTSKLSLNEIESFLHQYFWKKYGRGIIHCLGCSTNNNKNSNTRKHIEWFNVPIKELPDMLYTIDKFTHVQS